jgi:hypothetical protein
MPCPSCSQTAAPAVPGTMGPIDNISSFDGIIGATGPTGVPGFSGTSSITIGSSQDTFVDLAYSLPSAASFADSYITSIVSKKFLMNFEPTFFQIPYIYSAADNLINENYKKFIKTEDTKIITTYVIPYIRDLVNAEVTITTYLDILTNILFYEVPREFSYNSKDQASVAIVPEETDFVGKIQIPESFLDITNNSKIYLLNIKIKKDAVPAAVCLATTAAGTAVCLTTTGKITCVCCTACCGGINNYNCDQDCGVS